MISVIVLVEKWVIIVEVIDTSLERVFTSLSLVEVLLNWFVKNLRKIFPDCLPVVFELSCAKNALMHSVANCDTLALLSTPNEINV